MVARRAEDHPECGGKRTDGAGRPGYWRRVFRTCLCGLGRTSLGRLRARHHHRADAWVEPQPPGARRARIHGVPDSCRCGLYVTRLRHSTRGAARGWRRRLQ